MKTAHLTLFVLCIVSLLFTSCSDNYADARKDLLSAAIISNDDLIRTSKEMRAVGDSTNKIAPAGSEYERRLARLTDSLKREDGLDLNFKVYVSKEVNANATADGSIRIYSSLMDMMSDDELFYIIGHEIGHIKLGHVIKSVRTAYISSGLIKAAGASSTSIGTLTNSQLGDLLHTVINAQYSQKAEYEADNYGYTLMKKYKRDTMATVTALRKIEALGQSGSILSSHPDSADRAKRLESLIRNEK